MCRPVARLVVLAQLSVFGMAASALAVSDTGLRCQSAIGDAGRAFAATRLKAFVACNNIIAAGETCNAWRRDRIAAVAARALVRRIVGACSDVALDELDFPGACVGATGGSFVLDDLTRCIEDTHVTATDDALRVDYSGLETFSNDERRCQCGLGRAATAFLATSMRARIRCLDGRLSGALPEAIDCRAAVPPYGAGTGDAGTDGAIKQATARLFDRISDACVGADLAELGFPGFCPDPIVGAPGLNYVENCVRTTHERLAEQMLAAEYPSAATPTPGPTATPALASLQIVPASSIRFVGVIRNYNVIGTFTDGNARNFTQRVDYASSDESVAICPNAPGNRGQVRTVGVGTALITATEPVTGITSDAATLAVIACDKCVPRSGSLTAGCDPCVAMICAADPSCCTWAWTQACVDGVASICGESCPAAP